MSTVRCAKRRHNPDADPPCIDEDSFLRRLLRPVALACGALCLGLGLVACAPAATPGPSFPPGAIILTAENTAFDRDELFLPADTTFPFVLVNRDADLHNIAIRTLRGFDGELLYRIDPVSAVTVEVPAGPFAEGTYFFICELHPVMNGTVIVQ